MVKDKKHLGEHWVESEKNRLKLELIMPDFESAIYLVNKIADVANEINHHPDLRIYNYNHLKVEIYSHGQEKLTEKDYELAEKIDGIFNQE